MLEPDEGVQFTSSQDLNRKILFYRLSNAQDYLLASIIALIGPFIPIIFYLYPILKLRKRLRKSERLPGDIENQMRSRFDLPQKVRLRLSNTGDCYTFSTPFLSGIWISKNRLEKLDVDETNVILEHEKGHLKQYDLNVIYMFGITTYALLFVFMLALKTIYDNLINGTTYENLTQFQAFLFMSFFVATPVVASIKTPMIMKRREFLADLKAFIKYPNETLAFIKKRARSEKYEKAYNWRVKFKNWLFHPTFTERLHNLDTDANFSIWKLLNIGFGWTIAYSLYYIVFAMLFAAVVYPYVKSTPFIMELIIAFTLFPAIGHQACLAARELGITINLKELIAIAFGYLMACWLIIVGIAFFARLLHYGMDAHAWRFTIGSFGCLCLFYASICWYSYILRGHKKEVLLLPALSGLLLLSVFNNFSQANYWGVSWRLAIFCVYFFALPFLQRRHYNKKLQSKGYDFRRSGEFD